MRYHLSEVAVLFVNRSILTSPDFDRSLFMENVRQPESPAIDKENKIVHFTLPQNNKNSSSESKSDSDGGRDSHSDLEVFGGGGSSHNDN